jgi:hypothetical protein
VVTQRLLPPRLQAPAPTGKPSLKDDLLYGAEEIRDYLRLRDARQVFRLREKGQAPIFSTPGIGLTARKSALDAYFARLESEHAEQSKAS